MSQGKQNIIEEIKARADIVEVVEGYIPLKKTGVNHKGNCPFHSEKTPSFIVSEDKQIFTCFGCGATGDVITFVQKIENLEFHETIEKLAEKYGIDIQSSEFKSEKDKEKYYEINKQAALIFYSNLEDKTSAGADYVKDRGLSPSVVRRFGIGYAKDSWDDLTVKLHELGIEDEDMIKLGLVSRNASGRRFDKFRNRVIFPIINTRGKVIGFGGRAIGQDTPKYLNSQESIIFSKKNNLFGLNLTRKEINIRNCVILVEGYMDVISLYQFGVKNTVASLGTALTPNQAAMIKRYADNVVVSYDSDAAGETAALRAVDILYEAGCNIKVLQITGAKDPDEYVRKKGAAAFYEMADKAPTFVEFKVALTRRKHDMATTSGSVEFLKEVAGILKSLKSPVEADVYIEKIAADTKISAGAIRNQVFGDKVTMTDVPGYGRGLHEIDHGPAAGDRGGDRAGNRSAQHRGSGPRSGKGAKDLLEKSLIKLMLLKAEYIKRIEAKDEVFLTPVYRRIFESILSLYTDDEEIDIEKLRDNLSDEDNLELSGILENVMTGEDEELFFNDCMDKIKREKLGRRKKEILDILTVLDEESNQEQIRSLTKELMEMRNR